MITDFLGRMHPALVHLPIGILLLGVCFELLSSPKRLVAVRAAIPTIIFWGMIAAVLSCITGLALGSGGDYEDDLVQNHQWAGIVLAILSIVLYMLYRKKAKNIVLKLGALLTLVLIFVTGHLGGSITHGENFLSFSGDDEPAAAAPMEPIPNIQQAVVYTDIVQPLLQARCYSCHGTRKQKGKLRLDGQEFILQGGESGNTVVAGKPEESELIERLLLPLEDDDHMPPLKKTQLTREQVDILKWWVSSGADFHKRVSELEQGDQIKPVLLALQTGKSMESSDVEDVPSEEVSPADPALIKSLNDKGIAVLPVSRSSNYLSANFINTSGTVDSLLAELVKLREQLISLKMDGAPVGNSGVAQIAKLTNLRRLQISNVALTDESVKQLHPLKELRSLNLVGTGVTSQGLSSLTKLPSLKFLYLYKTGVADTEKKQLQNLFPETTLDFGNYSLPMLEGDTSEIKF